MSRYDLRDISDRLTRSKDVHAVVGELLGALEALQAGWRASLAFYEVSTDALNDVFELDGGRLVRRRIIVPMGQLPHRLVRNLFEDRAIFNGDARAEAGASPCWLASPETDRFPLLPLTPVSEWESCACLSIGQQEDLIGILLIVSPRKNAFGGKAVAEILPIRSIATVAIAQQLYRSGRAPGPARAEAPAAAGPDPELERKVRELDRSHEALDRDIRNKASAIEALVCEIEQLDCHASGYKEELERVKQAVLALEEQASSATEILSVTRSELDDLAGQAERCERTIDFMKNVFEAARSAHDPTTLPQFLLQWIGDHFGIERCSLMIPEPGQPVLSILAQHGIDPAIAARVRVRIGQGVAGWVAHNRRPLFVRARTEVRGLPPVAEGTYNSESFISVPLLHDGVFHGVLNLSNKEGGAAFDQADLDRALLAASVLAISLGTQSLVRRAAWAA
jgi:hypothetical protein